MLSLFAIAALALGQVDEEHPAPSWPVSIGQHPEVQHSILLTVDAPDGTVLVVGKESQA